jgi:hypothetical protein
MSDFLTHLASRSVNRLPVVQPRLASRFEVQAAIPGINPGSFDRERLDQVNSELVVLETEGLPDRESTIADQPTQPRPRESNPPTDRMPRQSQNTAQLNRTNETQPTANNAIESNAIQWRSPETANRIEPSIESNVIQWRSSETANRIEPSIVSPQSLLPFSALSNTSLQASVQPLGSTGDSRSREASHNADSLTERQDKVSQKLQPAEPSTGSSGIQLQPQITPRIEPSLLGFPAVATPPPPPTIHVTIGRIEVRAQTAAAPAKSEPRSPAPALTLERYLSQRSGGQT